MILLQPDGEARRGFELKSIMGGGSVNRPCQVLGSASQSTAAGLQNQLVPAS